MTYAFPDALSARSPRAFSVGEGPGAARNLRSCTLAESTQKISEALVNDTAPEFHLP